MLDFSPNSSSRSTETAGQQTSLLYSGKFSRVVILRCFRRSAQNLLTVTNDPYHILCIGVRRAYPQKLKSERLNNFASAKIVSFLLPLLKILRQRPLLMKYFTGVNILIYGIRFVGCCLITKVFIGKLPATGGPCNDKGGHGQQNS